MKTPYVPLSQNLVNPGDRQTAWDCQFYNMSVIFSVHVFETQTSCGLFIFIKSLFSFLFNLFFHLQSFNSLSEPHIRVGFRVFFFSFSLK